MAKATGAPIMVVANWTVLEILLTYGTYMVFSLKYSTPLMDPIALTTYDPDVIVP